MKPYIKIALFAVLIVVITATLVGLHKFNLKHPNTAKAKPDYVVTATVLQKEFEDNEVTASSKYVNKILEVNGTIASVTPADSTHLNIALKTGSEMSSVICTFPAISGSPRFKSGDEITLRGECSGFLMDVLLNNCAIVLKRK